MTIEEMTTTLKCSVPGCSNMADYVVVNEKIFAKSKLCFCRACAKSLYTCLGKKIVPKSPKNMLNKQL